MYKASTTLPTTGTVAGTYTWSVTYAGDANNINAIDQGGTVEQTVVSKANPTLVSTAGPAITLGTAAPTLTDSVVLAGGYYETGSAVFTLTGPGGFSYTKSDTLNGNGTYAASQTLPATATFVGTYTWQVGYVGDANNNSAADQGGTAEQTSVQLPAQGAYILNSTASGAVNASGSADVQLPGGLYVDSNSTTAVLASGNAQVNVGGNVLVVGGVSKSGSASVTKTGTPPFTDDPLAYMPLPSVAGLTSYGAVSVNGNTSRTLSPGIYTSIQVSGNASVTMNAGVYIIEGGGLSVSGNGNLTGHGVLIFNGGSSYNGTTDGGTFGSISLGGNGTIDLSAGSTGPYASVLVFQSRSNNHALTLSGNSGPASSACSTPRRPRWA